MWWLKKRKPVIQFYCPEAEAVTLEIDGFSESWPMESDQSGNWSCQLHISYRNLHGLAYHFKVSSNNNTVIMADPMAYQTERLEHGIVSRFGDINYRWRHRKFRSSLLKDIVIYETHLPALSRHESAKLADECHRGTYTGARTDSVISHLQRLGVAVEFLPLHASDMLLGQDWGYFTTSFRAMTERYAVNATETNKEVMAVVDAMHGCGIPVLLDVVFNHGGELLVKAWGENIVFRRFENGEFCHGSGCGPTIRTEHPLVRETIIQTLEHLVNDYHFDGFRFDLGALHDKETMREIDSRLPAHVYLIAEPWALGGSQWGKGDLAGEFSDTRWAVWNDDFRESGKTFLIGAGDHHNRGRLMCAIKGSHYQDGGWAMRPQQSINYLSSHDGKTLADFVDGNKHKVFLGMILVISSQGVPMISEGTELMFSKHGHDNSYDRPDLNQIDWSNLRRHEDLVDAVANLIELRKYLPHFDYTERLNERHENSHIWDIDWIYPTGYPHEDNVNAIGYLLRPPPHWWRFRGWRYRGRSNTLVVLLNGSDEGAEFHLPKGNWKLIVDGYGLEVNKDGVTGVPYACGSYYTHPGTGVILIAA